MWDTLKVFITSLVMVPVFLFLEWVLADTVPYLTIPVTLQLSMLIPVILFSLSGSRYGAVSGLGFSLGYLSYEVLFQFSDISGSPLFYGLFLPVSIISTGLASNWLEDKRLFVFPLLLALIIQVGFSWFFL